MVERVIFIKIVQVWVGADMPRFIIRCIESLNYYARLRGIEHVIISDKSRDPGLDGEYTFCNVPSSIVDEMSSMVFKYRATEVDYMRYCILRDSTEYMYYVDSDCYFIKDPFESHLVLRDVEFFSRESRRSDYVNNGIIGVPPHSKILKSICEDSLEVIESNQGKVNKFLMIGPKFINEVLNKFDTKDYIRHTASWMYHSSWQLHFKAYDSYTHESSVLSIIKNLEFKDAIGTHFFKPHGTPIEVSELVVNKIIDKIEEVYPK